MNQPRSADSTSVSQPLCDRVTCHREATVVLLFDPRLTSAWLGDIDLDSRTVGIGLCLDHANRVTVPAGWTLTDERSGTNRVAGGTKDQPKKRSRAGGAVPVSDANDAPLRLATVTPIPESRDVEPDPEATIEVDAEPDEPDDDDDAVDAAAADAVQDDGADDADEPDAEPDDVAEPTLWSEDQPENLRVDKSTPMLSRAFRAAHID